LKPFFALLAALPALGVAPLFAAEPTDITAQRAALLRKVESSSLKGWQKGSGKSDVKFRELNFKDAVAKLLTEKKLIENYPEAEPIAIALLRTSDPLSSLVAYEHLLEWVQAKNNPDLDADFQKEMVQLLAASQPYPIEYSLLFERVYDHALDTEKGPGLKGNQALKFALSRFREPDVLQSLEHERADKLFATAQSREPSGDIFERARRDTWAIDEVISDRMKAAQGRWLTKQKELAEISPAKLVPHFLRASKVKGDGQEFLERQFKDTSRRGRADALASYDSLVRHLMENYSQDIFSANHSAVALLNETPPSRYRAVWDAYVKSYEFAKHPRYGLGLSNGEAVAFALDFAKLPDALTKLQRFQEEWILRLQRSKDRASANLAAVEAANEVGLAKDSLSGTKLSEQNYWTKHLPPEIELDKSEQGVAQNAPTEKPGAPPVPKRDNSKLIQGFALLAAGAGAAYAVHRYSARKPCEKKMAQLSPRSESGSSHETDIDGFNRMAEEFDDTETKTPHVVTPKETPKHPEYERFADLIDGYSGSLPLPKEFKDRQ
jgi:hypothetical protein